MNDWIVFLFVHIVVPLLGIATYLTLLRKMRHRAVPNAPTKELFWVFGTYGVLIILVLTSLMWKWSGMASLGAFASMTIGPVITGIAAISVYKNRNLTPYHQLTFWLSVGYIGIVLLVISSSLIYNATN